MEKPTSIKENPEQKSISIREDLGFEDPRKISSFFDAVIGGTCTTHFEQQTLCFHDYRDHEIVYSIPFDKTHMAMKLLPKEQKTSFLDQHCNISFYPIATRKNALLSLFTKITEEQVTELATAEFTAFHSLEDLNEKYFTPNDAHRDISSIKANREALFDAAQKTDIELFTACLKKPLTKKPWAGISILLNKSIERIRKKGTDIILSPVNSDDDGLGGDLP